MSLKSTRLKATLFALPKLFAFKAKGSESFRQFLSSRDAVVQIRLGDNSIARHFTFTGGEISSAAGVHPSPDMTMRFKDVATAIKLMTPPINYADVIHAGKNFKVILEGDDEVIAWFAQLAAKLVNRRT